MKPTTDLPSSLSARYILEQSAKAAELAFLHGIRNRKVAGLAAAFVAVETEIRKIELADAVEKEESPDLKVISL